MHMFEFEADFRMRPDGTRVLLTPISWAEEHEVVGSRVFTAKAGMVHDGASIPTLLSVLNGPSIQLAATLHDAAYRAHAWDGDGSESMTRWEADLIILRATAASQRKARESDPPLKRSALTVSSVEPA